MSAFTGPISATELDLYARLWRLNEPLRYEKGHKGSGLWIVAPAGMITDGASVPRILWTLLPPWGSYSRAAAIHDYLCYLIAIGRPHPLAPTYQAAADIFDEAMKVCRTPIHERALIITGVRLWFTIPDAFRPKDSNPYPCGSVQPSSVVLEHIARQKAA